MLTPFMSERNTRQVTLVLPHNRGVKGYRVGAANTLNAAFTATTAMFDVASGGSYRSRTITAQRRLSPSTTRDQTVAVYDPEDFWVAAGALPHDTEVAYLRVRQISLNGVAQPEGPILLIPPAGFFTNPRPGLTISGSAPNVAAQASGLPPPGAMHIVLPRWSDNIRIRNTDGADELLVSFGAGQPETNIPFGQVETFDDSVCSELFLHSDGAAASFEIRVSLVNGKMA